ncbi:MAG: hypothetical protein PHW04_18495 [Candidatus Wallbacteria bacterium]|nr:hypothetical protein [Candidatus Wallbacteria bacterium]
MKKLIRTVTASWLIKVFIVSSLIAQFGSTSFACGLCSGKQENLKPQYYMELEKIHEHAVKNTREANVWTVYTAIFRTLDFTFQSPGSGGQTHVNISFSDSEMAMIRQALESYKELVFSYSGGMMKINMKIEIIEEPLKSMSPVKDKYWLSPEDAKNMITGHYAPGHTDNILAYVKTNDGQGQEVPTFLWGGALGGDYGLDGAGWISIQDGGGIPTNGELELHEWLHVVDWALYHRTNFPDELVCSPDDGRYEGQDGGDPCYRRKPSEPNWLGFYYHIMSGHITPEMWRVARCRP